MAIRHPGFSFQPTDEHLFFHYLLRRLNQEPLPDPDVVRDCDVYGSGDPWNIFDKYRDEKFYVFTVLKKNKSRVDRIAGSGTWKGEQSHEIRDSQGKLVGYKKLFTFKPKAGSNVEADKTENGHWIMYEYSAHPHIETECVLCVISNKYARKANKKECHKPRGRVQLEEENRPAKKACLLCYDHPNAVDNPSTTLPPSDSLLTTMTAVQQDAGGASSQAFGGTTCLNPMKTTMAVQNDIFYAADSRAFRCNGNTNSLPPEAANMHGDTCNEACWAFGGPSADLLPSTSMEAQGIDSQWVHQLMNMDIDLFDDYLFHTVVKQPAQTLNARNDLVESHSEGVPANWPVEFLDFGNCI